MSSIGLKRREFSSELFHGNVDIEARDALAVQCNTRLFTITNSFSGV